MARLNFIIGILCIMGIISFQSCEKNIDTPATNGEVEFMVSAKSGISHLKSDTTDTLNVSYHLLISINESNGTVVCSDKLLPLIKFGDSFISRKLKLQQNDYVLTKFMVVSPNGEVIYATPTDSSALAYLVNEPLPIQFNIQSDKTTTLKPEVLPVGNYTPEDFGYASFGLSIIEPIDLYAAVRVINPLSMAPINWHYTSASAQVFTKDWQHTFDFDAAINHVILRKENSAYTFIVNTADWEPQKYVFSSKEIMESSVDHPINLDIYITQKPLTHVIQPDAISGKDATIIDLEPQTNFGNSPYWATGYFTEPMLTVMRTTRSLIYFNLNSLPKSATIQKVYLRLNIVEWKIPLIDATTGNGFIPHGAVLQQITEPWNEDSVTWSNQPKTIDANQVKIVYHPEMNTIQRTYDVTSLFVPMQEVAAPNYGMMLKTEPDSISPPIKFASSDYEIDLYRPKLIIEYTLP